jgi:hypothetical protein
LALIAAGTSDFGSVPALAVVLAVEPEEAAGLLAQPAASSAALTRSALAATARRPMSCGMDIASLDDVFGAAAWFHLDIATGRTVFILLPTLGEFESRAGKLSVL